MFWCLCNPVASLAPRPQVLTCEKGLVTVGHATVPGHNHGDVLSKFQMKIA